MYKTQVEQEQAVIRWIRQATLEKDYREDISLGKVIIDLI
jgi:hypothetical protein